MGSFSDYSSPKTSYESSYSAHSTPKASSYDSSKVSTPFSRSGYEEEIFNVSSSKSDLNAFRDLITNYLEIIAKIEKTTENLKSLQQQKSELEQRIASHPKFGSFSTLFTSTNDFKGPKR